MHVPIQLEKSYKAKILVQISDYRRREARALSTIKQYFFSLNSDFLNPHKNELLYIKNKTKACLKS